MAKKRKNYGSGEKTKVGKKPPGPDPSLANRPAIKGLGRPIRKLRHWKQQFDPKARFVFRRNWKLNDREFKMGDPVPDGLLSHTRLRRFWESSYIELLEFDDDRTPHPWPGEEPEPEAETEADVEGADAGDIASE